MDAEIGFRNALVDALTPWAITLNDAQLACMEKHFEAMVQKNREINLTRIVDPAAAAAKHYGDSLSALLWERRDSPAIRTVLDIGTGAGFPAVPLAIARPDWDVTAVDGTRKKADFVRKIAADLQIQNLHALWAHSEHWNPPHRYDLIVFRALGPLGESLARAATHAAPQGWILAFKTAEMGREEEKAAVDAARQLALRPAETLVYELRMGGEKAFRKLLVYRTTR